MTEEKTMGVEYKKIQDGNTPAFKEFFEDFYPSLCFFANKIVRDEEVSNDIVQDAFIYFWEKRIGIATLNAAKSYLFKYVKNRCLNYLRDDHSEHSIKPEDVKEHALYHDFVVEDETYRLIHKAISALPPKGKQVIELTLDGLKNQEIAECLDVSINTVKTLKLRAFKVLREELKDMSFLFFSLLQEDAAVTE
ncbi:RNA polymerase sigma-70 factor, ECF subfamily [Mariniphaga anaerophila]|uniref:RNA polymerase sigma-70 factor, ECF subfamily n=1 Tax=Mariniphaga anaerophila TaxID=1484053 RepID=A0A1M4Y5B9_9BACT|nr:RNA polymerase sigma-70 factor [Mariniphaga anaerophila]SHF00773.1 RNA polymerase sigma-70 factor, ECF subfamily [Mariniphaga anaerophila]